MPDFSQLLSKPLDEVEKPKAWPAGTYHGRILRYEPVESREKKTPGIKIIVAVSHAGDDIDPESIAKVDFSKRQLNTDYWLTPDSEWRLKDLIKSCGIQTVGRTFNETLPELQNSSVIISVVLTPSRDGTDFYNNIDKLTGES